MTNHEYTIFESRQQRMEVPIWKKSNLTIDEAAAYSGVGQCKLRQMTDDETVHLQAVSSGMIKKRKLLKIQLVMANTLPENML